LGPCLFHNTGWVKVPVQFLTLAVVDFYIPQPAERQRIGDKIKAAMIFARADFVNMRQGCTVSITTAALGEGAESGEASVLG
jgi:hypothetical protein